MNYRVAMIGAGSFFTDAITEGMIRAPETFAGTRWVLVDVDEQRLQLSLERQQLELGGAGRAPPQLPLHQLPVRRPARGQRADLVARPGDVPAVLEGPADLPHGHRHAALLAERPFDLVTAPGETGPAKGDWRGAGLAVRRTTGSLGDRSAAVPLRADRRRWASATTPGGGGSTRGGPRARAPEGWPSGVNDCRSRTWDRCTS